MCIALGKQKLQPNQTKPNHSICCSAMKKDGRRRTEAAETALSFGQLCRSQRRFSLAFLYFFGLFPCPKGDKTRGKQVCMRRTQLLTRFWFDLCSRSKTSEETKQSIHGTAPQPSRAGALSACLHVHVYINPL